MLGVVETELEEDPRQSRTENVSPSGGCFRGAMSSRLLTKRDSDSDDDFDDVD